MYSEIISILAIGISAFATWNTFRFNKRQESFIESQEKLNRQLLEKQTEESTDARKAKLAARFRSAGPNKYRLKIYNQGKASARNVRLELPNGNSVLMDSEIKEKFPHERLDTYDSIELIAARSLGDKSKHCVMLIWDDDFADNNEQTFYPTF